MNSPMDDFGVITAVLKHLEMEAIPRALAIKLEVDAGQRLSEPDLFFFEEILEEMHKLLHVIDRHPEFQLLSEKIITLYHQITERALENQLKDESSDRLEFLLQKVQEWHSRS